jgi:hypothetical protein
MRWTHNHHHALLSCLALVSLIFCLCVPAATATPVTVNFQSLGLMQQDIKIFDAGGALVTTANTTSSVVLNSSESAFYTIQLQPSATNQDPVSLLDSIIAWLTQNAIIVGLLLVVLLVIARRR